MSEPPPPDIVGNASCGRQETLSTETIETILADFRSWLHEAGSAGPVPSDTGQHTEELIDLHTLLGQFLALRHEINLQTKAVRGQQEQNAETLRRLAQAVESLDKAQAAAEDAAAETTDEPLRPLLKTLLDVFDALTVAAREVRRVTESILPDLEQLLPAPAAPRRASLWGRLFRRGSSAAHPNPATAREHAGQTIPRIRSMLGSLLAGYTMSLQRVERTLQKHELEPIDCMGAAFEPEEMEVVEVVAGSGRPAGEVVEEVRRGYLWRGRVFRYAQVRVAKDQV